MMPSRSPRLRIAALTGAMLFASVLSCGREITGPDGRGGRAGAVFLDPRFRTLRLGGTGEVLSIGSVVEFDRVRIVLRREDGSIAVDTLVPFPANANEVSLRLNITMDPQAPATGEPLSLTMRYVNAAGDTVFSGGPVAVIARPPTSGTPQPVPVDIDYVGVGANAASIAITPTEFTGLRLGSTTFTATVLDSVGAPLPLAPVAFTSTDSQRVRVDLRTGATSLLGARGAARIIAQTLTGQADTADVTITPVATSVVVVSGANQQVRQGEPFPQPIRVRATAIDNLGVAGVDIAFDVVQGQGTVSQLRDTTDANGDAEVIWTAGDSAGAAILRASIFESVTGVNIGGMQLSSAANSLTYSLQPTNITAGNALPSFAVVVRDVTGDTVTAYNSTVSVALNGGTVGSNLVGTATVTALNGVAVFTGLTVDRAGTGYRLVASLPSLPAVPPLQSNTFNVAAAPPSSLQLFAGGGQTAAANIALADSIKIRVRDVFNFPVPGVTVQFAVSAGGGAVSPTTVVTDGNGIAATRWTLGPAGTQQITATVTGLAPFTVGATLAGGGGGPPVLYLGYDQMDVGIGRTRQAPVFLTNPTPTPLTVNLVMRDAFASWSSPSVVIPGGGAQALPAITGVALGQTWAVATSAVGTDSMIVTVDSATAFIDGWNPISLVVGDTARTYVMLDEPAGVGGVVITVRASDSSAVLIAPGAGGGFSDPICYNCGDLRAAPPGPTGTLLAPPAGTAVLTIPQGQVSAQLAVIALLPGLSAELTLEAAGLLGVGKTVYTEGATVYAYPNYSTLGLGQRSNLSVYRQGYGRRAGVVRLSSLNPAVATIDSIAVIPRDESYSEDVYWHAVGVGTADLVVEIGGVADTVPVTVEPAILRAYPYDGTTVAPGGRVRVEIDLGYDYFGSFMWGGEPEAPVTVTATSRDPGVARPEMRTTRIDDGQWNGEAGVITVGAGSTYIVYTAPGYAPDSTLYTVVGGTLSVGGNTARVGVGQVNASFTISLLGTAPRTDAFTATVNSSDPNVVRVLSPTATFGAGSFDEAVRLEGVSVGTAYVRVAAPGFAAESVLFQVHPGVLALSSYAGAQTIDPDSAQRSVSASTTDGSFGWAVSDTLRAVIRSTDPSVLLVTDSALVFRPNFGVGASGGTFRAIAPGTARIVVAAPGYVPDTSAVLTVRPPRLSIPIPSLSVGRGLRQETLVQRFSTTGAPLSINYTVQGPAGSAVLDPSDAFPIGSAQRSLTILGGPNLGTDTVIVTAAGMTPDTLYVTHSDTRLQFSGAYSPMETGTSLDFVSLSFRNLALFATQAVRDAALVRIVSRDTTVVKVTPDTVQILAGAASSQPYQSFQARAVGSAWIVAEHLNGSGQADSLQIFVRPPRLYFSDYGPLLMGMQERTYPFYHYVWLDQARETPLWVRIASSAPAIATVPDSIEIGVGQNSAYFEVTSGTTAGSTMLTFSADGFAPTGFPVFVTASSFVGYVNDQVVPGGATDILVYRANAGATAHPSLVPIPLRFTSRDSTIAKMIPDSAEIGIGADYVTQFPGMTGVAAGRTWLTISDRREGQAVAGSPGTIAIDVARPAFEFSTSDPNLSVAAGTSTGQVRYLYASGLLDSLWIKFQSVGGRFAPLADSTLAFNAYAVPLGVRGLTEGVDTLVITAAGFAPESLTVRITKGTFYAPVSIPNIRQGDSVYVSVSLYAADGYSLRADAASLTIAVNATANLQATLGPGPISSVVIDPGNTSASFWVKALAPGGGTVTISHPSFLTHEIFFGTRSP